MADGVEIDIGDNININIYALALRGIVLMVARPRHFGHAAAAALGGAIARSLCAARSKRGRAHRAKRSH